tara:strand:+ start:94 stop:390 length:297 start_codon:yes stop_codon:yes gene_type:complete
MNLLKFRIDIERKKGAWLDENYPQGGKNQYTIGKVEQLNPSKMPINKISGCQISDKAIDTKKELSKVAAVSHDTIAKVKKIQEKRLVRNLTSHLTRYK